MRNPFTSSKKSESEEETLDANLHQLAREDAAPGETTPDLSLARTLLLSASVTLASLSLGFAYHTVTVTLNLLAEDLKISEGDLQWASNAYLLGLVSAFQSSSEALRRLTSIYRRCRDVSRSSQEEQQIFWVRLSVS
jgi:hypothetical protein